MLNVCVLRCLDVRPNTHQQELVEGEVQVLEQSRVGLTGKLTFASRRICYPETGSSAQTRKR